MRTLIKLNLNYYGESKALKKEEEISEGQKGLLFSGIEDDW